MSGELIHNIYYDNGAYIKLTTGNEDLFNNHHKSLIHHVPSLDNTIRIYFTWASLLEAIGLGNFRRKSENKLDLTEFYIYREDINIFQKLDQAFQHAYQYFLTHSELSMDLIICKIEEQLTHCSNKATRHFVEDTLVRYKKSIRASPSGCQKSLAEYLAWDAICEFPFVNFEHIADLDKSVREKVRQINEWLLRTFHDKKSQGTDLSIHRLADKVGKVFFAEDSGEKSKWRKTIPYLLEKEKDLCDVDVIDFATLGKDPSVVITADRPEVIRQRLVIQLKTIRFLCNAEGSKLKLSPGLVLFVDKESCIIYDKLNVSEISEKEGIILSAEPISSQRDRTFFGKMRENLDSF